MPDVEVEVHLGPRRQIPHPVPAALRQGDVPQRALAARQPALAVAQAFEIRDQAHDPLERAQPIQVVHDERTRELPRVGLAQRSNPPRQVAIRHHRELGQDVDRGDQVETLSNRTIDRTLRQRRRRPPAGQVVTALDDAGDVERQQPDVGETRGLTVHGPCMHDVDQHDVLELPAELLERNVEEQARADDERVAALIAPRRGFQNHRTGVFQMGVPGAPATVATRAQSPQLPSVAHLSEMPRHRSRHVVEPGPKSLDDHELRRRGAFRREKRLC